MTLLAAAAPPPLVLTGPRSPYAVRTAAWAGGVAESVSDEAMLRVLVAASSSVRDSLAALTHVFHRVAGRGEPIDVVADAMDDAVGRLSIPPVAATFIDVTPGGLTLLHRGNPSPLVLETSGEIRAVVPRVPGAPLGGGPGVESEHLVLADGAVVVAATAGLVEDLAARLAGCSPTADGVWRTVEDLGERERGSDAACAVVIPTR